MHVIFSFFYFNWQNCHSHVIVQRERSPGNANMQFLYTSQTAVYCDLYSPSPEYTRTVHSTAAIKFNIRVVQVLHGSIPRLNDVKCIYINVMYRISPAWLEHTELFHGFQKNPWDLYISSCFCSWLWRSLWRTSLRLASPSNLSSLLTPGGLAAAS